MLDECGNWILNLQLYLLSFERKLSYFLRPSWQLGMSRGTRGTRSPRTPAFFPRPVPRWLEFRTPSLPPSPPLFPEFPRKVTILTMFLIFSALTFIQPMMSIQLLIEIAFKKKFFNARKIITFRYQIYLWFDRLGFIFIGILFKV